MKESTINWMKLMDRYIGTPVLYGLRMLQPMLRRKPSEGPVAIRRVLMIKLWGIGNLVMILPLIRAVRHRFPDAMVHFLTLEGNRELLEAVPALDGLITFQPKGLLRSVRDLLKMVPALRRLQPDLILDFEQFLKITPILANLSGALQSVGFRTGGQARDALYNVKVPYRKDRHMSLSFGDIVRSSGISTQGLAPLEVPRCSEAAARAVARIPALEEEGGPLVVLHPGSGDNFPGRRWPAEHFAALARRLVKDMGARCILTGTDPERELGARCEQASGVDLTNAIGRLDLMAFIELIARADLLVTNDTAPAHIGSALNTPLIAIYGPNTPELYGPLHEKSRVFYDRLPCSPCLTNLNAKTSRCRIPSCILNIDPEDVFQAALELLSSGKAEEAGRVQGGYS